MVLIDPKNGEFLKNVEKSKDGGHTAIMLRNTDAAAMMSMDEGRFVRHWNPSSDCAFGTAISKVKVSERRKGIMLCCKIASRAEESCGGEEVDDDILEKEGNGEEEDEEVEQHELSDWNRKKRLARTWRACNRSE